MNHTKGPWTIEKHADHIKVLNIREMPMKNGTINEYVFSIYEGQLPNEANLKLISAAPEMLDVLILCVTMLDRLSPSINDRREWETNAELIGVSKRIIKKAKGE